MSFIPLSRLIASQELDDVAAPDDASFDKLPVSLRLMHKESALDDGIRRAAEPAMAFSTACRLEDVHVQEFLTRQIAERGPAAPKPIERQMRPR